MIKEIDSRKVFVAEAILMLEHMRSLQHKLGELKYTGLQTSVLQIVYRSMTATVTERPAPDRPVDHVFIPAIKTRSESYRDFHQVSRCPIASNSTK